MDPATRKTIEAVAVLVAYALVMGLALAGPAGCGLRHYDLSDPVELGVTNPAAEALEAHLPWPIPHREQVYYGDPNDACGTAPGAAVGCWTYPWDDIVIAKQEYSDPVAVCAYETGVVAHELLHRTLLDARGDPDGEHTSVYFRVCLEAAKTLLLKHCTCLHNPASAEAQHIECEEQGPLFVAPNPAYIPWECSPQVAP